MQIFEKKPTTIKNFGIWVRYQSRTGYHNMYKEYRDVTLNGAVEQMYSVRPAPCGQQASERQPATAGGGQPGVSRTDRCSRGSASTASNCQPGRHLLQQQQQPHAALAQAAAEPSISKMLPLSVCGGLTSGPGVQEMGSRHRARAPVIQIIKTATVPAALCKRESVKQFHDSKIRFPLTRRSIRCALQPVWQLLASCCCSWPNAEVLERVALLQAVRPQVQDRLQGHAAERSHVLSGCAARDSPACVRPLMQHPRWTQRDLCQSRCGQGLRSLCSHILNGALVKRCRL